MVGKARSSNFTLSEKLDLLKLVKPYVKILEEHTNKHSVIVEKNRCWDIIAVNYNASGVDRPPRTAQGLAQGKSSINGRYFITHGIIKLFIIREAVKSTHTEARHIWA